MILNAWSVTALFLVAISVALACAAALVALRALARRSEAGTSGEDVLHLLGLLLGVLFVVRFLAWPGFYLLLDSYVPALASGGVMCAYGVSRIQGSLVGALEVAKPVVLLGLALFWVTARVAQLSGTRSLERERLKLALPLSLAAALEALTEGVYLFREKAGETVTCCTQYLETTQLGAARGAGALPDALAGALPVTGPWLFLGVQLFVVAAALAAARRTNGWPALTLLAAVGVANMVFTERVWAAVVAPRVLQLPYHRCLYELVIDVPAFWLAGLLAVGGNGALVWPALLQRWRRLAPEGVAVVQRKTLQACALALSSAAVVVAVHLL